MRPPRRVGRTEEPSKKVWDIAAVIAFYGGSIPSRSGWAKMCCIHGERNASATINIEEGAYACFSCGLKGDAIAIIRDRENCSYGEAIKKYASIVGLPVENIKADTSGGRSDAVESKSYESGGFLANRFRRMR